jgi:hypothetical protein
LACAHLHSAYTNIVDILARKITILLYDSALLMISTDSTAWIIDGGCTKHIVPSLSDLTTITNRDPLLSTISIANKERLPITAVGLVTLEVTASDGTCVPMTLTNVLVVPGIASRLYSCRWGFGRRILSHEREFQSGIGLSDELQVERRRVARAYLRTNFRNPSPGPWPGRP